MRAILVTGGAGYIGSHVCKALLAAGFLPVTYDNLSKGHRWAVKWGPLIEADIHDRVALQKAFQKYGPIAVIHLASFINVRESLVDPGKYYHNNVAGSLSLIEEMCASGIKRLVFSSTASVYGAPQYLPIDEKHPKNPLHAYGKSKHMVEEMLKDFFVSHCLSSLSLRYFNASGADATGEIGEAHDPETHLVPLVLLTALKKRAQLTIYGNDYPTPDGTAIRDYIHVTDLAEAHVKAVQYLLAHEICTQLNLGTGQGYSVQELIRAVEKVTGRSVKAELGKKSPDSPVLVADATKAQETLDWKPNHSDLETIIQTAWRWHEI